MFSIIDIKKTEHCFFYFLNVSETSCSFSVSYHQNYPTTNITGYYDWLLKLVLHIKGPENGSHFLVQPTQTRVYLLQLVATL